MDYRSDRLPFFRNAKHLALGAINLVGLRQEQFFEDKEGKWAGFGRRRPGQRSEGAAPAVDSPTGTAEETRDAWRTGGTILPKAAAVEETREESENRAEQRVVKFADDPNRSAGPERWKVLRDERVKDEKPARAAMKIFETFYALYGRIDREAERVELILGESPISGAVDGYSSADGSARTDGEVLLSKPANPEQNRIAQQLKEHGGVLVQSPPGTGKTHTIGNLIGHLLA